MGWAVWAATISSMKQDVRTKLRSMEEEMGSIGKEVKVGNSHRKG